MGQRDQGIQRVYATQHILVCPYCGAPRQVADDATCARCGTRYDVAQATEFLTPATVLRGSIGIYAVVKPLNVGGQSKVYLARALPNAMREQPPIGDPLWARGAPVVVKELRVSRLRGADRRSAEENFAREAELLMRLAHHALAHVYDLFIDALSTKPYMVMEYVPGRTLEEELVATLEMGRALDWRQVAAWGVALVEALAYLHAQTPPIIYRDLKPANVMRLPDGRIKLIDFGIARPLAPVAPGERGQKQTAQSETKHAEGTDGYAPPEQYIGRWEPRSDLYALGATLAHLCVGVVPPATPDRIGKAYGAHSNPSGVSRDAPASRQNVSASSAAFTIPGLAEALVDAPALAHVIHWAMRLRPAERPRDAQELGLALAYALEQPFGTIRSLSSSARWSWADGEEELEGVDARAVALLPTQRLGGAPGQSLLKDVRHPPNPPGLGRSAPSQSTPPALLGALQVSPTRLRVTPRGGIPVMGGWSQEQLAAIAEITVINTGRRDIEGTASASDDRLWVNPHTFHLPPGGRKTLELRLRTDGLGAGAHQIQLHVTSTGGDCLASVEFSLDESRNAQE